MFTYYVSMRKIVLLKIKFKHYLNYLQGWDGKTSEWKNAIIRYIFKNVSLEICSLPFRFVIFAYQKDKVYFVLVSKKKCRSKKIETADVIDNVPYQCRPYHHLQDWWPPPSHSCLLYPSTWGPNAPNLLNIESTLKY